MDKWLRETAEKLVGRKIIEVRYMTKRQAKALGFFKRPLVIVLDSGEIIFPLADDEGNDGGALGTSFKELHTIPVIL